MKRLLIEEGLPFKDINAASHREKQGNSPDHPRRLHIWWARRPLAMSRAIVLGSVLPAPQDDAERQKAWQALSACALFKDSKNEANVERLRRLVRSSYPGQPPTVLDCFAGGGAIPLEALRLGCETTAVDLNPVAHLIEKCMLEYPQRFGILDDLSRNTLAQDVEQWGQWVGERARAAVSGLFRDEAQSKGLVWFWARTMPCSNPACGIEMPLTTTWALAKGRKNVGMKPGVRGDQIEISLDATPTAPGPTPVMKASSATCPACGTTSSAKDVRAWGKAHTYGIRLLAVLEERDGNRVYRVPCKEDYDAEQRAGDFLAALDDLPDGTTAIPDEPLERDAYRKFQMLPFGLTHFRDLLTPRQRSVAVALSESVRAAHAKMLVEGVAPDRSQAIATYLALAVSHVLDRNSMHASWDVTGQNVRNTFGRQAIPMVWDFTEINPFEDVSGSWAGALESISLAIERCSSVGNTPARVIRGNAQALDALPDASFDAVVVDPPYYDSIQYADLSDFFYVWFKRSLWGIHPDLVAAPLTPKAQEVIQNTANPKSATHISADEFESRLGRAIKEMRRLVKPDGAVTIVFAHTESDAWERLLRALLGAELIVSTSWPMTSEMGGRATGNISAVLGSSVVLVCRPREMAGSAFYDDVVRELDQRIAERLDEFEALGLDGADYLVSAIGPALEVFGKYTAVQRLNGDEVSVADLLALARRTVARHAMRRLLGSEGLTAVDDTTLYYLTWRWAYGASSIPVDEAQKLGKAFNVDAADLDGVDGLVETRRDSYRLRGPDDRKRVRLGPSPVLIDVLHASCKLFDEGRRSDLAELLASTGMTDEPAFWASARAIAESLDDGDRERILLVNLLGGQSQAVAAARLATPTEDLRLFEVGT